LQVDTPESDGGTVPLSTVTAGTPLREPTLRDVVGRGARIRYILDARVRTTT